MKNIQMTARLLMVILTLLILSGCKKKIGLPELTTSDIVELTPFSATTGGNIISDGNSDIIERGICWIDGTDLNPKITGNKTSDGHGAGVFASHLINLLPGLTYNVRAYATNSQGTQYGQTVSFTTLVTAPEISDLMYNPYDITPTSIKLHGLVNPMSLNTEITFQYGLTETYEKSKVSTPNNISIGGFWEVTAELTDLIPGSEYHYRIKAENELGITYSKDYTFITAGWQPTITNISFKDITLNSVNINATVNPGLLETSVVIEYGTSENYGNSYNVTQTVLTGGSDVEVSAVIDNLTLATKYYFRIKSFNQTWTTYSIGFNFTTYRVTDLDNNYYHSITIGSQEWLQENLQTLHFQNGDPIPVIPFNNDWTNTSSEACTYYDFDLDIGKKYGFLYNYYAATDPRNVCPEGWHVPTLTEWTTLVDFAGGESVAAPNLRISGISNWNSLYYIDNNDNSTNFTALGAGTRLITGEYWGINYNATFWTSTLTNSIRIFENLPNIDFVLSSKNTGYSVRCLKN